MSHAQLSQPARQTFRILLAVVPTLLILSVLKATVLSGTAAPAVVCIPGTPNVVGGIVFQDDNANGVRSVLPARPNERGVGGVTVTAYDVNNTPLASIVTDPDGTYVLNVPNGTNVRVEFTNYPAGYFSGPFGSDSGTNVTFVQSPTCNVDLGLVIPSQVCPTNPQLATNCYVSGEQLAQQLPVLVSFPYTAGGTTLLPNGALPPPVDEAESDQIGTTWGLAHQRQSNSLFAAAFMKRHTGFGPGGTGAIYRINRNLAPTDPSRQTLFLDLNALFPGSTGANPHPAGTDFLRDPLSWNPVGKISLGDIDISEDEQTLWAVNLNDRQLYEIPIGVPPVAPPAGSISRFPVPSPTDCPNPATDIRPFATGVNGGLVYVGMVCSAESTVSPGNPQGDRTAMRAYVYSFNPATNAFSQVLNFPLNYSRGCAVVPGCVQAGAGGFGQADWLPWVNAFTVIATFYSGSDRLFVYPQPMLTDIVFDGGDMVLGIRDRFGDQTGFEQFSQNPADPALYSGVSAGDILRACANGAGGWTLEANGTCGGRTTGGAGNGQGVGSGEYFYQEDTASIPPPDTFFDHDEVSLAGLAQLPGYSDTLETVYDIFEIYDGGILWLNNVTGQRSNGYQVLRLTTPPITFGKAAGLGDLEVMCGPPPLEIGNRVWRDMANGVNNGRQDATDAQEYPLSGVTVNLYDANGVLVATTLTDANGEYIFNASNVPGGLLPFITYTVRLDNPADYAPLGTLAGMTLTLSNAAGVPDTIDNDGVLGVTGFPEIVVVTGAYNDNQHTYDFGFYEIPTAVELLYFRVDGVAGQQVSLAWATEVEIDNFGFNVYRSPENNFGRATLIHFEPSSIGGGGSGATYAYQDTAPADGVWWYWLGDVDTQGYETLHGPVTALVGADALLPYRIYLPLVVTGQP